MHAVKVRPKGAFHWVGDGFPVRSAFGYNDLGQELNPFILLDYAEPHTFSPSPSTRGVGEHPHKGFETVTIAYQGEIAHRDSSGGGGIIGAGDVQWMTAGSGLVHEEFHSQDFSTSGGVFEMVQLWVNLPAQYKNTPPRYRTLLAGSIPTVSFPNNTGSMRIIAGEYESTKGPALTFTPINIWEIHLQRGGSETFHLPGGYVKAALILRGTISCDGVSATDGELMVFDRSRKEIPFRSLTDTKVLFLSGAPINEPLVGHGPFVMNTQEEIRAAFNDFKQGRFGALKNEKQSV